MNFITYFKFLIFLLNFEYSFFWKGGGEQGREDAVNDGLRQALWRAGNPLQLQEVSTKYTSGKIQRWKVPALAV